MNNYQLSILTFALLYPPLANVNIIKIESNIPGLNRIAKVNRSLGVINYLEKSRAYISKLALYFKRWFK